MEIQVPLRELINVVTLAQALIFAGVLLVDRFRQSQANRILIVSFVIIATVKIDQLFQLLGGVEAFPVFAFIFIPVQWLLTPSLYFFVIAKINGEFKFSRKQLWHLLPALASLTYLSATYYFLPLAGKVAYIESGATAEPDKLARHPTGLGSYPARIPGGRTTQACRLWCHASQLVFAS